MCAPIVAFHSSLPVVKPPMTQLPLVTALPSCIWCRNSATSGRQRQAGQVAEAVVPAVKPPAGAQVDVLVGPVVKVAGIG